jgi:formylglycine-generating enzyme required for sulfatase activity
MDRRWISIACIAAVGASLAALSAHADDPSAWLKDRQARFAAFHAAHPHPDAEIARIKAKTAALLAAAPPMDPAVDKPPLSWKATDKPEELWDGADLPEMIVVPAGEYSMGSPTTEYNHQSYEAPLHRVRVGYSFAVGKYPITVGEFARFVAETGYDAGDSCFTSEGGQQPRSGRSWRNPSFPQTSDHPAVCLNWNDAQAYVSWLAKTTGHAYRLLSEAEYEYVNRAGSQTSYWWGEDAAAACLYANGADLDALTHFPQMRANTCHDGYVFTSPVGSFKPNPFGLYDITGNAWSWLADCWNETYVGAPTDGSADMAGDCGQRTLRRGSWSARPTILRSAQRIRYDVGMRVDDHGLRVARTF